MSLMLGTVLLIALVAGAIVGSFLTVLAVRIPQSMLADEAGSGVGAIMAQISWPGSHCNSCKAVLRWHDNIPVLSYLLLGGKCRACAAPYGRQYIVLESCSALVAAICVWRFGWSGEAGLCFALLAGLIVLTAIDFKEQLLPDVLLLPLLPLGLLFQARYRDGLFSALVGMALGFLVMWVIAALYRLWSGRDGMGFGDIKMAAVLGAWLGAAAVPFFLMAAFAAGVLVTLPLFAAGRLDGRAPVPFGPFLCLSAMVFLLVPSAVGWTQAALLSFSLEG